MSFTLNSYLDRQPDPPQWPPHIRRLALNITEACEALGVSWDTWHEHIEPHIKMVRVGKRKIIPVTEIQKWLDENAEKTL